MSHDYKADIKMAQNGCESDSSRDKISTQISKWPSIIRKNNIRPFRNLYVSCNVNYLYRSHFGSF